MTIEIRSKMIIDIKSQTRVLSFLAYLENHNDLIA